MLSEKLRPWISRFRKYYFTYSKGFYHFPYNGNSPKTLVDSFKGLPFVKHSAERQSVSTSTPMMEGGLHYQELEEGCWLVYSKMRYKANVAFDLVYSEESDNDYYMLSLNNVTNLVRAYTAFHKGAVVFPRYSWTFFKPKVQNCSVNFKGDDSRFITLFFNERWLRKNLVSSTLFTEAGFDRFLASDVGYILWPLDGEGAHPESFARFDKWMIEDSEARCRDILQLKYATLSLVFDFLGLCRDRAIVDRFLPVEYGDRFKLEQVENYLNNHLLEKFPGLDFLAEKFGISKTRLKDEFKQLYGKPVYQYFQAQQMSLSKTLLTDKAMMVKELAYRLGYESPGKFSAAFKKHHAMLPSELQK